MSGVWLGAVIAIIGVVTGALLTWATRCDCPPQPLPRYPSSPISTDGKVDPRHQDPAI